jgi:hypothetical protein
MLVYYHILMLGEEVCTSHFLKLYVKYKCLNSDHMNVEVSHLSFRITSILCF